MNEFPANSHKQKITVNSESKKIEKIVDGEVTRRKKPLGKRMAETFVGGDIKSVGQYVVFDVMIPAAKDMFSDAISTGIERMLFGENRTPSRRSRSSSSNGFGHVAYNRFASSQSQRRADPRGTFSSRARATHDFDEIILESRIEAEEVIARLYGLLSEYQLATVSDLYEMVGITGSFTDEKWGWTDINGAGVTRIRNGYLLDLPRPEPIRD